MFRLKRFLNSILFKLLIVSWIILVVAISCQREQVEKIDLSAIDYNLHVRPIINKNCIVCHGGVKKSSGLSFLFREEALAVNKSGKRAIIPGDAANSEMIARIKNDDPEVRMPMDHDALSADEIVILTKWIDQGAEWKEHWAFLPPEETNIPEVENSDWVNNFDDETGIIHQYRKDLKSHPVPNSNDPDRIVFAHQKNIFGQTLYKFFGIFKTELSMTNSVHHYFKRISEQIDLNKYS